MIVVDSSAILSVLFGEPEEPRILVALGGATTILCSAANALECVLRLAPTRDLDRTDRFDAFVEIWNIEIVAVTPAQLALARAAHLQFGKGRHPARLNFGDCFAYALARERAAPLLFVGGDFAKTDVVAA